ncbi:hypothetical protein RKE30_20660 [Streptomyces sp. Li-HN-5-11]|nr:hypothetical protein [Streptomyces sp. Li-HN-5-11]WNM32646.1 hypothetical protein RKE30_20660 [Streptomyces sp. Li-HN-5-11]WOP38599.1 hypothetical protein RKE32_34910 [Streptomyces sp. Li-HN-5-13]
MEPMEAWERPDGYWLATSRSYRDSPGWSEQEKKEFAACGRRNAISVP